MQDQLSVIADDIISQIMSTARSVTDSQRLTAISGITPKGAVEYKSMLQDAMAVIAMDAIDQARREVPKAKKVKLSVRLEDLPPKLRDKITRRSQLLVGKQIGDLQKTIEFAYLQAEDSTDSNDQVEQDLRDSALGWLDGVGMEAGATLTSATVINDSRNAFFFDSEVLDQLDGFVFINGDPVTQICQDLSDEFGPGSGNIIAKDDPNLFRYTPPLHWNCKSSIEPVLAGDQGNRDTKAFKPSKSSLDDQVQFHERCACGHKAKVMSLTDTVEWDAWFQVLKLAI